MKEHEFKVEFDFKNVELIESVRDLFDEIFKDDRIRKEVRMEYGKKYTDILLNNKHFKEVIEKLGN